MSARRSLAWAAEHLHFVELAAKLEEPARERGTV
jgi:hypothetical protein